MELHAVVIRKPITLEKAKEIASQYIDSKKKSFYRETNSSYRFRNIPKQKFKTFKSKKINKDITLIYGEPKIKAAGFAERGNVGGGITGSITGGNFLEKLQNFILRYNPITLIGKALMSGAKSDLQEKGYFRPNNRLPY
jgi:hypothetical protein